MTNRYYDNTRLSAFRECRRKYYFRHVRHIVPEGKLSPPLAFGDCWHRAMNVVWGRTHEDISDSALTTAAFHEWCEGWEEDGYSIDLDFDEEKALGARTPAVAQSMLIDYVIERRDFIRECEIIAIEQPFAVPLDPTDPTLWQVGRLDKVVRYRGKIIVPEHKTTSAYKMNGPFREDWINSFNPNSQVDGYMYACMMMFGECEGVWVDAALVHRTQTGFRWFPIQKTFNMLDSWLWEARDTIGDLEYEMLIAEGLKTPDHVFRAFRKNTQACSNYGGCPYATICRFIDNPHTRKEFIGYKVEPWSPFDVLHLERLTNVQLEKDV